MEGERMSLSKRDTLVRYLDPLKTIWEDAQGGIHFSVANAIKAFDLEDTRENRDYVLASFEQLLKELPPEQRPADIIHRKHPDSPEYFEQ